MSCTETLDIVIAGNCVVLMSLSMCSKRLGFYMQSFVSLFFQCLDVNNFINWVYQTMQIDNATLTNNFSSLKVTFETRPVVAAGLYIITISFFTNGFLFVQNSSFW